MTYQDPKEVDSPRGRWRLIEVLWDGGDDEDSLAVGMWDDKPALAMRWNGSAASPVGIPNRGAFLPGLCCRLGFTARFWMVQTTETKLSLARWLGPVQSSGCRLLQPTGRLARSACASVPSSR